jgi:hypothetical protein
VVACPPILRVVAVVLNTLAVPVEVVVILPPLTARLEEAVMSPAEVMVPVPVVTILLDEEITPVVVKFPLALIVKVGVVVLLTCKATLVPVLSVIVKAEPVPLLARANAVALPLLVKLKEVPIPAVKAKSILLFNVVAIVLPPV